MKSKRYNRLMKRARKLNVQRDKLEKAAGFSIPEDGLLSAGLRDAMSAIEAGIVMSDWNCVAEGQAILEVIEKRARGMEPDAEHGIPMADGSFVDSQKEPEILVRMIDVFDNDDYRFLGEEERGEDDCPC